MSVGLINRKLHPLPPPSHPPQPALPLLSFYVTQYNALTEGYSTSSTCSPNAGLMLGQRQRRWFNIKTPLGQLLRVLMEYSSILRFKWKQQ